MERVLISFFYHNSDFIWTDDLPDNLTDYPQNISLRNLAKIKHLQEQYELL